MMPVKSAGKKRALFRQICELIPPHLVPKLARKHGITPWNHTVSLLFAQFTHAIGLNDVCGALWAKRSAMASIRGADPPSRNGLSHANKTRNPKMAEDLFWSVLRHLEGLRPGFGGEQFRKLPQRFKRTVHVVDSSTIKLFANYMDWARHRRRKAAAKLVEVIDSYQPDQPTGGHSWLTVKARGCSAITATTCGPPPPQRNRASSP